MASLLKSILRYGLVNCTIALFNLYDWKEGFFFRVFNYLFFNRIQGDYLEFGVFQGRTIISAYKTSQFVSNFYNYYIPRQQADWEPINFDQMRFIGFDSFEGMPEAELEVNPEHRPGGLCFSLDNLLKKLRKKRVDLRRVVCVKGFFNDSLTDDCKKKNNINKAAFIYIDCDLYESALTALNFCTDLLQDGTIIAFDDWNLFKGNPQKGERRAFLEWKTNNADIECSHFLPFGWHGMSFIVHKA